MLALLIQKRCEGHFSLAVMHDVSAYWLFFILLQTTAAFKGGAAAQSAVAFQTLTGGVADGSVEQEKSEGIVVWPEVQVPWPFCVWLS